MIPKSKVITGLMPSLFKPRPAQSQHQHQKQDQNQSQAQNVEVKIFPNVTEINEKVDDERLNELEAKCNYQSCVIDVYERITELMKKYDPKNEMIIPEEDLKFIIKNMSGCDEVDIQYDDSGCLGVCSRTVDKIHVTYADQLYNLKYSCETLVDFLKNKRISWKEVR